MKKILITGTNSYIGKSLEQWLKRKPGNYIVDKISLRNEEWKTKDFSTYDSIVHTAGIAHIKETRENHDLYYKINTDLTFSLAKKAKEQGVSQFIFLSSMSVYGKEIGVITENTIPTPTSAYGKSKLEAEKNLVMIENEKFSIVIVRPPMVYGESCPGNYNRLSKLAKKTPLFPKIDNKRSMIYIDNLSEFLKKAIDTKLAGVYHPQNSEYINTSHLVETINKVNNKKIKLISLGSKCVKKSKRHTIKKLFGDLVYEMNEDLDYNIYSFEETIKKTEGI